MELEEYLILIGKNIVDLRNSKGVKQVELAHKIGIEDSALRRIESGRTNPTIKSLLNISEALGVELVDLLKTD